MYRPIPTKHLVETLDTGGSPEPEVPNLTSAGSNAWFSSVPRVHREDSSAASCDNILSTGQTICHEF